MRARGLVPLPDSVGFELQSEIRAANLPLERAPTAVLPRAFDMATGRGRVLPRGELELVCQWWSLPWVAEAFDLLSRVRVDRRERALLLRWFEAEPELLAACRTTEAMARESGLDPREVLREVWFQRSMAGEAAVFPRSSYCYNGRPFT
jgi:hypothetical protein